MDAVFGETGHHSRHTSLARYPSTFRYAVESKYGTVLERIRHALGRLGGKARYQPQDDGDEQELLEVDRMDGEPDTDDIDDFRQRTGIEHP